MTYQSVHTGAEVDAAVAVLNDVQEIRTEVEGYKNTVVSLAGQVQTDAGNAATDALTASQAASEALDSKNAAYASEQAASGHASNADSARAQAVVARNGAEDAQDSAWEAEGEVRYLLGESEATIDSIRAEILRQKYGAGPYPSLDIGFVGARVLDRRINFTRASDATHFDEMGIMQTAGPGEPRFDYDPVTGECRGLLIEAQVTNLILHSDLPATQTVTVTSAAMTLSFWGTGSVTLSGAYSGSLVGTSDSDRVWLTFTPDEAGELILTISGNVERAQLEVGSYPTSYIPTEGSQVTRAADLIVHPMDQEFNRDAGTFVIEADTAGLSRRNDFRFANPILSVGGPGRNDTITFFTRQSSGEAGTERYTRLTVSGYPTSIYTHSNSIDAALTNVTTETVKVAFSYDRATGVYQIACAGEVQSYGSQVIPPMVAPPELLLGRLGIKVEPDYPANIRFQRVAYYPRALTNAQLQALTA